MDRLIQYACHKSHLGPFDGSGRIYEGIMRIYEAIMRIYEGIMRIY
jgi:hypothetical protein